MATEALAEILDMELPTVEMPDARDLQSAATHEYLVNMLRRLKTDDPALQEQLRRGFRSARHLLRVAEIGDALEAANIDDIRKVTGHKFIGWRAANEGLERFVLADIASGRFDRDLTWLFHRMNLRNHMTMGPSGSKMTAHYPCQRFDGRDRLPAR